MEQLINSLKKLGLNRYEAQAYIGLTRIIVGKAEDIASVSNIPRSKVYATLNELEKKGFVEIKRERPLIYKVVEPSVIFKTQKEKLINELETSEKKLEKVYVNEISEAQAPVWLIHTPKNIIEKEIEVIKQTKKSIVLCLGFLLKDEAQELINAIKRNKKSITVKIIANSFCFIDNEKIEIIEIFKKSNLKNLEIIEMEIPMIKMLISDEKELIGTFTQFSGENNSINPESAIGVNNKYAAICKNFNDFFLKQFFRKKRNELKRSDI